MSIFLFWYFVLFITLVQKNKQEMTSLLVYFQSGLFFVTVLVDLKILPWVGLRLVTLHGLDHLVLMCVGQSGLLRDKP